MVSSPPNFRIVPDVLRDTETSKGHPINSPISKALLSGKTIIFVGPKKTWGSLYTLAKNHKKKAHIKTIVLNNEKGTLIWFDEQPT